MEHILKEYTWLLILTAVLVGFIFPHFGILLKPYLIYLLMLLMFFSCLNIKFNNIIEQLHQYKDELKALAIIHIASPLIIFFLRSFFSSEIYIGLIIVTSISSGLSVVFLSELYGGKASISLVITSLSNLLSPFLVPLIILIFSGKSIELNYIGIMLTMIQLVIVPIIFVELVRKSNFYKALDKNKTNISLIILFLLILGVIAPVRDIILDNLNLTFKLSILVATLSIVNFYMGHFIGKSKKEKLSYAISTSYKNFTLATVVALTHFSPLVALPSVIYTVVNNLLLIPLQLLLKNRKS